MLQLLRNPMSGSRSGLRAGQGAPLAEQEQPTGGQAAHPEDDREGRAASGEGQRVRCRHRGSSWSGSCFPAPWRSSWSRGAPSSGHREWCPDLGRAAPAVVGVVVAALVVVAMVVVVGFMVVVVVGGFVVVVATVVVVSHVVVVGFPWWSSGRSWWSSSRWWSSCRTTGPREALPTPWSQPTCSGSRSSASPCRSRGGPLRPRSVASGVPGRVVVTVDPGVPGMRRGVDVVVRRDVVVERHLDRPAVVAGLGRKDVTRVRTGRQGEACHGRHGDSRYESQSTRADYAIPLTLFTASPKPYGRLRGDR